MARRLVAPIAALVAVFAVAGSALSAKPSGPLARIGKGLDRAASAGVLDRSTVSGYKAIAARAVTLARKLPPVRAQTLKAMLDDVAGQADDYDQQWALTLFSMLELNEQLLASRGLPPAGTDVYGDDGVLYRFVTGHGYEFHPLGNFSALNTLILAGKTDAAKELADALVARGVLEEGRMLWSYPFPFAHGDPPWRSGMAQAVAAQALARVGQALGDRDLLTAAGEAYAAIPGRLVRSLPAGPWIKLYSFDAAPVLNAQLQSIISIGDYAQITGNTGAAGLSAQLRASAETLLPKFDTGYWSLYSLNGQEAPLGYHDFVVSLLKRLAARTQDTTWSDYATRFQSYETQAPVVKPDAATASAPAVLYPAPQDGYLDTATFRFWLSKLSSVSIRAGGKTRSADLGHGSQAMSWSPRGLPPGTYRPYLTAVDAAGNRTSLYLRPVVIKAVAPPVVDAHVAGLRTLVWSATDEGTPWLHLVVKLDNGAKLRFRDLGHVPLAGRAVVATPPGTWRATLVAGNSARQAVTIDLGSIAGR